MTKEKNKNNKIIYIIFAIGVISIILMFKLFVFQSENNTKNTFNSTQGKTYTSNFMKFTIDKSDKYIVNEDQTFVDLITKNGKINISRISTNFTNLDGYLSDFDQKRKITIANQEKLSINNFNAIDRLEIFNGGPISQQKVYFIYVNNWVYAFSTSSPELYSDLDQIARSFRYTP